jgi:ketosteroid isomerase-like protein
MLRRDMQEDESVSGDSNRRIWVIFAVIAFVLLAAGFYLLRFRHHTVASSSAASVSQSVSTPSTASTTQQPVASPPATSVSQQPVASPSATSATQPPVATPAAPSPAAGERTVTRIDAATIGRPPDSPALPAPKLGDPKVWLEGWAAAMRSRDAVAQASFYADPVSQYIDRRNVSNAALVQAKKADIGRRQGLWTFTANDVVVENKTPSEATVRLVKHYMVETEPSQVSEISVNTRMQLKVVNGQWKIVSEQELHTPALAAVNPIDR